MLYPNEAEDPTSEHGEGGEIGPWGGLSTYRKVDGYITRIFIEVLIPHRHLLK